MNFAEIFGNRKREPLGHSVAFCVVLHLTVSLYRTTTCDKQTKYTQTTTAFAALAWRRVVKKLDFMLDSVLRYLFCVLLGKIVIV